MPAQILPLIDEAQQGLQQIEVQRQQQNDLFNQQLQSRMLQMQEEKSAIENETNMRMQPLRERLMQQEVQKNQQAYQLAAEAAQRASEMHPLELSAREAEIGATKASTQATKTSTARTAQATEIDWTRMLDDLTNSESSRVHNSMAFGQKQQELDEHIKDRNMAILQAALTLPQPARSPFIDKAIQQGFDLTGVRDELMRAPDPRDASNPIAAALRAQFGEQAADEAREYMQQIALVGEQLKKELPLESTYDNAAQTKRRAEILSGSVKAQQGLNALLKKLDDARTKSAAVEQKNATSTTGRPMTLINGKWYYTDSKE